MSFLMRSRVRCLFFTGLLLLLCTFFTPSLSHAAEVNLAWDPNTEPDVAGYKVYYGLGSRNYDRVIEVGNTTSCVVTGLEQGRTYYFAATAVNMANIESDFSNEVSAALTTSNQPPLANAGPDQNVKEGVVVTLTGANSADPEGGVLTYSWSQVLGTPVTLSTPSAVQLTFTPPNVGPNGETLGFQLTVTDSGGLQSTDTCLVNVLWINQPPSANAGPDLSANEGAIVTLNGSDSSDPDGLALSYEWVQTSGTPVALSNPFVTRPTFVAPNVSMAGETLAFQLTVTDSGSLQARDNCIVNVVWLNQPPVANAGPDQNVNQGVNVTLDGIASTDPDGGLLAYSWLQVSGAPVTLDNAVSAQPRFVANTGGASSSLVFSLTVTDSGGLSTSDQCSVVVNSETPDVVNTDAPVVVNNSASGIDLKGQWLSLTRSVKRSFSMINGKIRIQNLGGQAAPSSILHVYLYTDSEFKSAELHLGSVNVSSVVAGGYVDVNFNQKYTINADVSPVYLLVLIDSANAISETNETNNVVLSEPVP